MNNGFLLNSCSLGREKTLKKEMKFLLFVSIHVEHLHTNNAVRYLK